MASRPFLGKHDHRRFGEERSSMAPRKERKLSPAGLALLYLRSRRGWTQKKLAGRLGFSDAKLITKYERGTRPLHREHLISFAAVLGYPPEAADLLVHIHGWLQPLLEPVEPSSPVDLTVEEQRALSRTALAATGVFLTEVRKMLIRKKQEKKADAARRQA